MKTYHDVVWADYGLSLGVLGKWAATLSLEKWAGSSHVSLLFFSSDKDFPEELDVSGVALTLVAHLAKLVFKLSHGLACLEGAAILELWAVASGTFLLLREL